MDNLKYVDAATLIGLITLLGAAIALMNIMLVCNRKNKGNWHT